MKKFYNHLSDNGSILFDVSSFAHYNAKQQTSSYEYSEKEGFWSPAPYYAFHQSFKYETERLLLDKFSIVGKLQIRESYNWLQCYTTETISEELQQNNFAIVDYFANVAGDIYTENSSEIAIVAKKAK